MYALRRLTPVASRIRYYSAATPLTVSIPLTLSEGEQTIFRKLAENFNPTELKVQDVSGGCGTFYAVLIVSEAFKGLPTVKQHRLVTESLKSEIEGIHGIQINTKPAA